MTWHVCSTPGCGNLHASTGACKTCRTERDTNRRRKGNPYSNKGHRLHFREHVLARDPICTQCLHSPSTVADHHPIDRDQLIQRGLNPNDPQYGRGLCTQCHNRKTASEHGFGKRDT